MTNCKYYQNHNAHKFLHDYTEENVLGGEYKCPYSECNGELENCIVPENPRKMNKEFSNSLIKP